MVNLPVTDTFAVRVNAGWNYDAGFINQPNLYALDSSGAPVAAQPGNLLSPPRSMEQRSERLRYRSARISALWKPIRHSARSCPTTINSRRPAAFPTRRPRPRPSTCPSAPGPSRRALQQSTPSAAALRGSRAAGRRFAIRCREQHHHYQRQGRSGGADPGIRLRLCHLDLGELLVAAHQPHPRRRDRGVHQLLLLSEPLRPEPAYLHSG